MNIAGRRARFGGAGVKYGASSTWGAGEAGVSGDRRELKKELEGNGAVDGRVRMWAVDGRERVRVQHQLVGEEEQLEAEVEEGTETAGQAMETGETPMMMTRTRTPRETIRTHSLMMTTTTKMMKMRRSGNAA